MSPSKKATRSARFKPVFLPVLFIAGMIFPAIPGFAGDQQQNNPSSFIARLDALQTRVIEFEKNEDKILQNQQQILDEIGKTEVWLHKSPHRKRS